MEDLQVKNVSVVFPGRQAEQRVHALANINLTIYSGDFVVALGASGCGKTTLLNLMAGFITPSQGEVLLGGGKDRRTGIQPRRRIPEARAAALAQRRGKRRVRPETPRGARRAKA